MIEIWRKASDQPDAFISKTYKCYKSISISENYINCKRKYLCFHVHKLFTLPSQLLLILQKVGSHVLLKQFVPKFHLRLSSSKQAQEKWEEGGGEVRERNYTTVTPPTKDSRSDLCWDP